MSYSDLYDEAVDALLRESLPKRRRGESANDLYDWQDLRAVYRAAYAAAEAKEGRVCAKGHTFTYCCPTCLIEGYES